MLPFAVFCHNTNINVSTNYTPFELIFGKTATLPIQSSYSSQLYNYDDYSLYIKSVLHNMHTIAKNSLIEAKEKSKKYYDKSSKILDLEIGDLVLIENIRKGVGQKLQALREGPYTVIEICSDENVKIDIKGKIKLIHKNRLLPYFSNMALILIKN